MPSTNSTRKTKGKTTYPIGGRGEDIGGQSEPRAVDEEGAGGEVEKEEIVPEGWDSEEAFLAHYLTEFKYDFAFDKHNMDEAYEDLRFVYVDQWDEQTRQEREDSGRPCITVNTLPQFIGQVIGDRRLNKTSIKLIPELPAHKQAATVRAGIIKGIEYFSDAERVYDACCEDQVAAGISNFEITMEYARNDAFEQNLFIRPFSNPFGVTWDRMSRDITGKDARHCFVSEEMPRDIFEKEYPDYPIPSTFPSNIEVEGLNWSDWCDNDMVKVMALWVMVEKPATFALMADGKVEDVTGQEPEQYADRLHYVPGPDGTQTGYVREGVRTYAQRWLITGYCILEGPYELPISRLPIIKVSGRVGRVGTKQYRFGLVRWARDPSLMRNYWRSIAVETLAMAPKAQWIADHTSIKGREDDFRAAHLSGDPLLVYNTGKNKPERVDPPALPTAVLQEAAMNTQDIKDVTGLHDASLGIRSNEVSGKAIMARQREGDVATITFHDHLNASIQEAGSVLNELIPICYDTTRTVLTVGADDAIEHVAINDPTDDASPDMAQGRYHSKVVTGPSFTTQRQEASELMLEMTKTMPELMSQAADITMETLDVPGSERLAERFRKLIPAAQQEEQERQAKEAQLTDQPVQQSPKQQAQAAAAEQAAALAQAQMEAQLQTMQLQLREQEAKTMQAEAQAKIAEQQVIKAQEDARAARANADRAQALAEQADDDVVLNAHAKRVEIHQKAQPKPSGEGNSGNNQRKPKKGTRK